MNLSMPKLGSFPVVAALSGLLATSACGGASGLGLSAEDNNPKLLGQAMAMMTAPAEGRPMNATGKPLGFFVTRGKRTKTIIAYDLAGKKELWRHKAAIRSKISVGSAFVVFRSGDKQLTALDVTSGQQLWQKAFVGEFLGLTADASKAYYVVKQPAGPRPTWAVVALNGKTGANVWSETAKGTLGVPAAHRGLVFAPFLTQWLVVMNAETGKLITRIKGVDEQISFVQPKGKDVFFGSKGGVFLLDKKAASGKKAEATYGSAKFPKFIRGTYHWDAFDPVQTNYTAYDRNRVLWRGQAAGDKLAFSNSQVVVHTYRFLFAFGSTDSKLKWAYSNPREDVISSVHSGKVIGFASMDGVVRALDPASGKKVYEAKVKGQIVGATFDVEGWNPRESIAKQMSTVDALVSISRDRDRRFADVKKFAISALADLPGGDASKDLLAIVQNPRTPPKIYEKAVEALIKRKEPGGLKYLVRALEVKYDFIKGTKPTAIGVVARAIYAMRDKKLDKKMAHRAGTALLGHIHSPQTEISDLVGVIKALGVVGVGRELGPLRGLLLSYRGNPEFSKQTATMSATVDVLLANGGPLERETVAYVSEDAHTQPAIAAYAKQALRQTAIQTSPKKTSAAKAGK